jgi:FKBP12-rapamycin complex-associated protein
MLLMTLYLFYETAAPIVKIAGFSPQLVVITSKQRPRRLTIHGEDGENYDFLLKGHEDLRQDERVMQVRHSHFFLVFNLAD